jgi:hypothetical protein
MICHNLFPANRVWASCNLTIETVRIKRRRIAKKTKGGITFATGDETTTPTSASIRVDCPNYQAVISVVEVVRTGIKAVP